jgi:N-acetylglucosaminyldiphosphoundecaprenol N-acetyl-beta-D-mannosaminyltransferase
MMISPALNPTDQPCYESIVWPRKVDVLGVGVSVTDYRAATDVIVDAALRRTPAVVACQAVHAVVTAAADDDLLRKVNSFELVTPDGQPVRWSMNLLHKTGLKERVYGPELMLRVCQAAAAAGVSVYLYGGSDAVCSTLQRDLPQRFPGLKIAGAESPPFRPLTDEETAFMIHRINQSGAGIVFIGLGCPKQDHFGYAHRTQIQAVQMLVGAAFDFHAGAKKMAPRWMQQRGLEWLYRLLQEPRRLWRRYLVTNSLFVAGLVRSVVEQPDRAPPESEYSPALPAARLESANRVFGT